MRYAISIMALVVIAVGNGVADDKKRAANELDKKVVDIVKQVGALYENTKSLHVDATLATTIQEGENKREIDIIAAFDLERPNHFALRSRHANDANAGLEVFCDGKKLSMQGRRLKQYTETDAPADLAEVGQALMRFGPGPSGMLFQNLLAQKPGDALMEGVTACSYAAIEKVAGAMAHHLKFTQPEFDWELWVAADGKPLVLKMSSSRATDAGKVTMVETYKDWKLDTPPAKDAFHFTAPADAKKMKAFGRPASKDG
jgi:hypothetical protein